MSGHTAIVGAGLVSSSWAIVFARADWTVKLFDTSAAIMERLLGQVRAALEVMKTHGSDRQSGRGLCKHLVHRHTR